MGATHLLFHNQGQGVPIGLPLRRRSQSYIDRMIALYGANLIQYLPFDDAVGSATARDASGNSRTGSNTDVTAGSTALTGHPSYSFNGTSSFVNAYSASLSGAYSDASASIGLFFKGTGSWDAGEYFIEFANVSSNYRTYWYTSSNGVIMAHKNNAEVVSNSFVASPTDTLHLMVTLDGTNMRTYLNGSQVGDTDSYTAWGRVLSVARVGSYIGSNFITGNISDLIVLDRAATPAEVAATANPF